MAPRLPTCRIVKQNSVKLLVRSVSIRHQGAGRSPAQCPCSAGSPDGVAASAPGNCTGIVGEDTGAGSRVP